MDINVTITAPELSAAISNLAAALHAGQTISKAAAPKKATASKAEPTQPEVVKNTGSTGSDPGPVSGSASSDADTLSPPAEPVVTVAAESEASAPPLTIEAVRAAIMAKGKPALPAVKKIIESFGTPNLSQVPAEKYPALLEAVAAL